MGEKTEDTVSLQDLAADLGRRLRIRSAASNVNLLPSLTKRSP